MSQDVDAHDQEDATATELAIAAAIAEVLAHPPDIRTMTAERAESIMEAAVGVSLRFYAQRVLQLFVTAWRGPGTPIDEQDYAVLQRSVEKGVRQAIDDTGESVRDIIRANAAKADEALKKAWEQGDVPAATSPTGRGTVIEQGLGIEADAYNRLKVGMSGVARVLTTRAREQSKWYFAEEIGAVGKAWRTRRDTKVRTSHGDLEGDFVLMDDKFVTINGAGLRFPGDPSAPLFETINCRCRLSYRMGAEA